MYEDGGNVYRQYKSCCRVLAVHEWLQLLKCMPSTSLASIERPPRLSPIQVASESIQFIYTTPSPPQPHHPRLASEIPPT